MFGWGRMTEPALFELPPTVGRATEERAPVPPARPEEARALRPERQKIQWLPRDLDKVLPEDQSARAIWDLLDGCAKTSVIIRFRPDQQKIPKL